MRINTKQAVKRFYASSSFDLIYQEAVANSLDANATSINININADDEDFKNLSVTIWDNGEGLTNKRFEKFSSLLEVDEQTHKGIGRLVYLNYFSHIDVVSVFEDTEERSFIFSNEFEGKNTIRKVESQHSYTQFTMKSFTGAKIHDRLYLNPSYICQKLLETFYMRLYLAKRAKQEIEITVTLNLTTIQSTDTLTTKIIPTFLVKELEYKRELWAQPSIYYYIRKVDTLKEARLITALSVDDRTNNIDVIAKENIPPFYELIFLLVSDSFRGKVDDSRQNLTLTDVELQVIKKDFRQGILEIISKEIPGFAKNKEEKTTYLHRHFPHLLGYIDDDEICLTSQNDIIKKAQDRFFLEQRAILGASELSKEQYEQSMNLSARVLAEYILFRQRIIERLKNITSKDKEEDIHNILAPKKERFEGNNLLEDIYRNNIWVLDDKFMSYRKVLSDLEMREVINVITNGEVQDDNEDRPDITLFFSGDPNDVNAKVDVVFVELKRLGIGAERNSDVTVQLNERARALSQYYGNRVQRIWYYGVIELDEQTRLDLRTYEFKRLYSKGTIYYKYSDVYISEEPEVKIHADMYIMDYRALVTDAEERNSTFMEILKNQIKISSQR